MKPALVSIVCLALLLVGCRQPGFPASPARPVTIVTPAAPDVGAYVGVHEDGFPLSYRPAATFAAATGVRPRLLLYYSGWDERFKAGFARQALAHGAMPLIQMEPYHISLQAIAAGASDGYLRSYAQAVRAFGRPVIIGFAHEMNGSWYTWGWHRSPVWAWVAAWRHVVTVFRQQGAANVIWLWTVNRIVSHTGPIASYWPGSQYVTWIGLDGYYYKPGDTFSSVFGSALAAIHRMTSKPVLLAEVGVGQVAGQAAKIPGLFAGIRSHHLLGLVWFDKNQHQGPYHQDWRLEGHPAALAAFRAGARLLAGNYG